MTQPSVVAIITRTKDRIVLLRRAIESVVNQTYPHWRMTIVNDGGEPAAVEQLVQHYASPAAGRIEVIHNTCSLGMHGASAVGLQHAAGDLVVIHDDDDSWAPAFLSVAVANLERMQVDFPSIQGVTTYCHRIMERVQGQLIHIDSVEPFNGWVPAGLISLERMLTSNFVPPISFLFTRRAFDTLGQVYETIPYLGDWDFFVRFLSKYDVYVVPQYLAFYHWRTNVDASAFSNSITADLDRHRFYRQLLLNQWLRADLTSGRFGVGAFANLRNHLETIIQQGVARDAQSAAQPPQNVRSDPTPAMPQPRANAVHRIARRLGSHLPRLRQQLWRLRKPK